MKKIIFAIASICMMVASVGFTSCGDDDDKVSAPTNVSYNVKAYVSSNGTSVLADHKSNQAAIEAIISSTPISSFTESSDCSSEVLEQKAVEAINASGLENKIKAKVKELTTCSSIGVSYYVTSPTTSMTRTLKHQFSFFKSTENDDVEQSWRQGRVQFQDYGLKDKVQEAELDSLAAIAKTFGITYNGKRSGANEYLKTFLETSEEAKEFREGIAAHIAKYNNASKWYISIRLIGENGLYSDSYYYGMSSGLKSNND